MSEGTIKRLPTGGRVGPPTCGVRGSMSDFVRRHLAEHGGSCTRQELLAAMQGVQCVREKLEASRGFKALLRNMYYGGDLLIDGDLIRATPRALRRFARDYPAEMQ